MYRTYATPLQLDINSSQQLSVLLMAIGFFVMLGLWLASLDFYLKFLCLFVFIFLSFISCKNINNKKTIIWKEDNEWEIIEAGVSHKANLLAGSFVSQWLSILNFKLQNNNKKTILVFADAINKEQFRKLRVRLKVDGI